MGASHSGERNATGGGPARLPSTLGAAVTEDPGSGISEKAERTNVSSVLGAPAGLGLARRSTTNTVSLQDGPARCSEHRDGPAEVEGLRLTHAILATPSDGSRQALASPSAVVGGVPGSRGEGAEDHRSTSREIGRLVASNPART